MINSGINEPYENIDNNNNNNNNPAKNVSVSDEEYANKSEEFSSKNKITEGFGGVLDTLTGGAKSASQPVTSVGGTAIDNRRSAVKNFETTFREKLNNMNPALTKFVTGVVANVIIVWIVWKIGSHVIWFNSLPRNVLATMFPPGYQYLLDVLKENEKDPRCTGDVEENVGGKRIKAVYTDDQRDSMTLKKTCCPHLEHPIPEGEETMVACFPLGTGQNTIDSINAVNPNFKVWNNDYSECVLYGVWKNKNEQENDAVRLQNLQMEKKIKMAQRGGSGRQRGGAEPGGYPAMGEKAAEEFAEFLAAWKGVVRAGRLDPTGEKSADTADKMLSLSIAVDSAVKGGWSKTLAAQHRGVAKDLLEKLRDLVASSGGGLNQSGGGHKALLGKIESLIENLEDKKKTQSGGGKRRMFRGQMGGDAVADADMSEKLKEAYKKDSSFSRRQTKEEKDIGEKHIVAATAAATAKHNSKQAEYEQQWDNMSQGFGTAGQMSAVAEQTRQNKILDLDATERAEYYQQFEGDKQKLQDQEIKTQSKLLKLKEDWVNHRIKTNIKRDVDAAKAKFNREQKALKAKARRDLLAAKQKELLEEKAKKADNQDEEKKMRLKSDINKANRATKLAGAGDFIKKYGSMFLGMCVNLMKWCLGCSFDQTGEGMGWLFGYQTMGGILTRFGLGIKTTISYVVYSCMVAGSDNVIASALIGTCGVSLGIAVANMCWFSSVPLMWALYEFNLGRIGMYLIVLAIIIVPLGMLLALPLGFIFMFYTILLVFIKLWVGAFSNHGEKFKKQLRNCSNIRASLRRLFLILTFFTAMSSLSSEVVSGMLLCFIWIEYKNYVPSISVSLQNAEKAVDNLTKTK